MFRIICIAIGYLFGCFQTAYLITRHKISQDTVSYTHLTLPTILRV